MILLRSRSSMVAILSPPSLGMPTKNLMTWLFFHAGLIHGARATALWAAMALAFLLASFSADSARATLTNSFCYGPSSAAINIGNGPSAPLGWSFGVTEVCTTFHTSSNYSLTLQRAGKGRGAIIFYLCHLRWQLCFYSQRLCRVYPLQLLAKRQYLRWLLQLGLHAVFGQLLPLL